MGLRVIPTEVGTCVTMNNYARGYSLFIAISLQLNREVSASQLRRDAVSYISNHMDEFLPLLQDLGEAMMENREIPHLLNGQDLSQTVLALLRLPWTWTGAESIVALACQLQRIIRVYQEGGPTLVFAPHGHEVISAAPLRITYCYDRRGDGVRTHFESVIEWRPPRPQTCDVSIKHVLNLCH